MKSSVAGLVRPAIVAAFVILLSGCGAAAAQQPGAPALQPSASGDPLEELIAEAALARELAAFGRRTGSPIALIAAAEILQRHTPVRTEGEADPSVRLLDEARALRPDDQLMILIDQMTAAAELHRGTTDGPRSAVAVVAQRGVNGHSMAFRADLPAVVYVEGDGRSELEVHVLGQSGNMIARSGGGAGAQTVRWTPARTESVRVEVRNLGGAPNEYLIVTN